MTVEALQSLNLLVFWKRIVMYIKENLSKKYMEGDRLFLYKMEKSVACI